jgi:hypothetical protein
MNYVVMKVASLKKLCKNYGGSKQFKMTRKYNYSWLSS